MTNSTFDASPLAVAGELPWHLRNDGGVGGRSGPDLNVASVWRDYKGHGVTVGVFDDGTTLTNSALVRSFQAPTFGTPGVLGQHSTAVAGIIAADGSDGRSYGVATGVSITTAQVIGLSNAQLPRALAQMASVDIANNSWGWSRDLFVDRRAATWSGLFDAIENAAEQGRGGRGTALVVAAGNDGVRGGDANMSNFASDRHVITVAAVTDQGTRAAYSNTGASLLVSGLSGGGTAGITTTDLVGSAGYSAGNVTSTFSGTSAATPMVSGVIALMLEANRDLGWRDVKTILANAARPVDGSPATYNGGDHWNGGGLGFSNDVGFGLVDAHAAVRLAETWTVTSTSANEVLLTGAAAGVQAVTSGKGAIYNFRMQAATVETVQVEISGTHARASDLLIELVSPSGVVSTLMRQDGGSQAFAGWTFTSNAFWGEDAGGVWTVRVRDTVAGADGVMTGARILVAGAPVMDDDTFVFTDQYGALGADASRAALRDTAGYDTINAAAIVSDTIIDLRPGATSWLAGRALTIDEGTWIERAFTGDGDDQLLGNGLANVLAPGRGSNQIDGGAGFDQAMLRGSRADFVSTVVDHSLVVTNRRTGEVNTLRNVEYVQFDDGAIYAVSSAAEAAMARLYAAVFDRDPDAGGMAFWSDVLGGGRASLHHVADEFIRSSEFTGRFGRPNDYTYTDILYRNVLGRGGEAGGVDYWTGRLGEGADRADVALAFAASDEAVHKTAGSLHVIYDLV